MASNKLKIGIFGSAADEGNKIVLKAQELGKALGQYADSIILVNGACEGIPLEVIKAAKEASPIEVHGYSSCLSEKDQLKEYATVDLAYYSTITYMDPQFSHRDNDKILKKYRNLLMVANCDAGIIVSGRWGTMSEFSFLTDFGKTVGVLTGTGGFADEIKHLTTVIQKPKSGKVLFSDSPQELVKSILAELH
ncbi:MAG: hypothetical protein NUV98_05965 [Candidatus Roizmanbacteria bacterium]|nr:hypothetical protein [Candidatus Roizmanbacteria bacterium]